MDKVKYCILRGDWAFLTYFENACDRTCTNFSGNPPAYKPKLFDSLEEAEEASRLCKAAWPKYDFVIVPVSEQFKGT